MLYEFRASNFKSFRDEFVFSLKPAQKQKGLDYSVHAEKLGRKTAKALCSAVIYGPNASGKTNIISAMGVLKNIVLSGSIRNGNDPLTPNAAANLLELIPNCNNTTRDPVSFSIEFSHGNLLFSYTLKISLGLFLEDLFPREILGEELQVNENLIFKREKNQVSCSNLTKIRAFLPKGGTRLDGTRSALIANSLQREELFLTNGFKSIVSPSLVARILDWFSHQFLVVCHAEAMTVSPALSSKQNSPVPLPDHFKEAMKNFGVAGHALGYVAQSEGQGAELCSFVIDSTKKDKLQGISAKVFESYGTIRFAQLYPLIERTLRTGAVLAIDEFDASIHPMVLINIVNCFHNDEINIHGAQLIFNTHNPIFLNSNYYRRDEIKFVEKDKATQGSVQYSLSDFGTKGKDGVRKNEDYLKNYFINRYGALVSIDFTDVFKHAVEVSGVKEFDNEKTDA